MMKKIVSLHLIAVCEGQSCMPPEHDADRPVNASASKEIHKKYEFVRFRGAFHDVSHKYFVSLQSKQNS